MLTCTLAHGRGGPVQLQAVRATEDLKHRISADRVAELKFKRARRRFLPTARQFAALPLTGQESGVELTDTPTLRPAIFIFPREFSGLGQSPARGQTLLCLHLEQLFA